MNTRKKAAAFRKALCAVACILIAFCFCGCKKTQEDKYPSATEKFFVNDFAGVLSAEDAEKIYSQGVALNDKTTAQAVVVTVESLDGEPIDEYALNLGRQWGVGTEEKDNGIVILLSEQDREIYVAVGYGLEGTLPDSKTGRIIDNYGIPYFSVDDFSAGLREIYNSVVNEIYIEYNITPDESYTPVATLPQVSDTYEEETSVSKVAISWLVLIVLVLLYTGIFGRRGGLFIFGSPRFFGGFHHHGGFGGSGGGFGGFRGGGGSFGGGGAGRKF